jgi:hypothetical protein
MVFTGLSFTHLAVAVLAKVSPGPRLDGSPLKRGGIMGRRDIGGDVEV